jgi:hypothetical protein
MFGATTGVPTARAFATCAEFSRADAPVFFNTLLELSESIT